MFYHSWLVSNYNIEAMKSNYLGVVQLFATERSEISRLVPVTIKEEPLILFHFDKREIKSDLCISKTITQV